MTNEDNAATVPISNWTLATATKPGARYVTRQLPETLLGIQSRKPSCRRSCATRASRRWRIGFNLGPSEKLESGREFRQQRRAPPGSEAGVAATSDRDGQTRFTWKSYMLPEQQRPLEDSRLVTGSEGLQCPVAISLSSEHRGIRQ